jgi:hypothetical protein
VITFSTAGVIILATAISTAAVTLSSSTAAAGPADAYLTSVSGNTAAAQAARPDGGSSSTQEAVIFGQVRAMRAEHQQEVAVEKAAAAKAMAAKAAARKAATNRAAAKQAAAARAAAVTKPSGSPQQIARQMLGQYGWSSGQFSCLNPLWAHESGWRVTARNSGSGAYGIPQALPGSQLASAGSDWQSNAATQIKWGLTYIQGRYGSPCGAWAHEQANGWY